MKVSVLAENTSIKSEIGQEHGLSLFLETGKHNILFDTGAGNLFQENALKMGIDLSQVDLAVLSHGHSDHGGGLPELLRINQAADIYISQYAFQDFRARRKDGTMHFIGLDASLAPEPQIHLTSEQCDIDENLFVFSGVKGNHPRPLGNANLYVRTQRGTVADDFRHEQNLVICEQGHTTLVAGCAHSGILNILEHYHQMTGRYPNTVLGGFHLYNPSSQTSEDSERVKALAEQLLKTGAQFYTGHCTGEEAYELLRACMGNAISYLAGGSQFEPFSSKSI